jgi:macrolide-specific efflux system membrane fusion protein
MIDLIRRSRQWLQTYPSVIKVVLWSVIVGSPLCALVYAGLLGGSGDQNWRLSYAEYGDIETHVAATGTLEPKNYVEVGAQVSGQVKKIHIQEGDVVQQGQLLVEIDASVFETKVANAEASLENKRAQLQQQLAELELAQLRLKRNEGLFKHQAISEDTLVDSRTDVRILKAKIAASNAQIKADEASLAGDKVSLSYTSIYAPISGTIASIDVREGQTLNATNSAPTVLQISDLAVMTLRAEVSEADISRLYKGMAVRFATLGRPKDFRWSELRQILPTPNVVNDVVLYQVLVDVDNSDGALMDAMSTQVFFVENAAEDVLLVPLAAVRETRRGSFIRTPGEGQEVLVPVELGIKNRTQTEVLSGLNAGDAVIAGTRRSGVATQARSLNDSGRPPGAPGGRRGGF